MVANSSRFTFHVSRFRHHAAPLLALVGLILLFFHRLAFTNLILARGDTFLYFYPYWQAAAEALRAGRVPLWNPDLFMGAPFLANSQVGFFYPLNWPLWLLLPTPYAVSASILLHLFIAGWGTYLAGRRALSLDRSAALVAAVLFALGGYLTAQVEHVNQLQGLAWLPWFLVVIGGWGLGVGSWGLIAGRTAAIAALFTLQLLAGHTQTAFITGVGVLVWLVAGGRWQVAGGRWQVSRFTFHVSRNLAPLFLGGLLALTLTAVQLLPTLELSALSVRQGGLPFNEVLSFSLHPLLLGRALLPAYGQSLFTEYVAFLPLTALLLAGLGAWRERGRPEARAALLLVIVGLLLAFGRFNPFYWLLARLPGFDLFRVPARWLALYALGMAFLAGWGWQVVSRDWQLGLSDWRKDRQRPLRIGALLLLGLMGWSVLSVWLARFLPVGPEAPAEFPSLLTGLGWLLELTLGYALLNTLALLVSLTSPESKPVFPVYLLLALFFASRSLPYNTPTTPEAYFDRRPAPARLMAETQAQSPPGRFLSLSGIFFDPGDQAEIDTIYADQLPPAARYDYTIAIKQKEIIAPNLSMGYDLAAIDGFDGGILPLASYSELSRLLLPDGERTTDGRLRENLTAAPDDRWLDLFNARYLITDKVGDVWHEGVFFDLQLPVTLAAGQEAAVGYLPSYEATELWLVAAGEPGTIVVGWGEEEEWLLPPEPLGDGLWSVNFPRPAAPTMLTLTAASGEWRIEGLTLVDSRDGTFQSLVMGDYRLIHSGDVKIYENLDVRPRAFLVYEWEWQPDTAASVAAMRTSDFDPRRAAVLTGTGEAADQTPTTPGNATITRYEPERVVIQTTSDTPGLLILTDAWYPGWEATVDGQPVSIYPADGLFRGVMVAAGRHEVEFSFRPGSVTIGRNVTLIGIILWLSLVVWARRGRGMRNWAGLIYNSRRS